MDQLTINLPAAVKQYSPRNYQNARYGIGDNQYIVLKNENHDGKSLDQTTADQ